MAENDKTEKNRTGQQKIIQVRMYLADKTIRGVFKGLKKRWPARMWLTLLSLYGQSHPHAVELMFCTISEKIWIGLFEPVYPWLAVQ
ncbi:MAG: hypothetical protein HQM04_10335 [Magnetococcales bacterium]|nr:hypothetical protein [Magnetococcales bacterium]MBF0115428.1 hypothetical protein [Magnetococcales bacterium]